MMFALIKDTTNLNMYGDIPEVFEATEKEVETYYGDWNDAIMLCDNLLPILDKVIENHLLDLSDIDYFDKDKCVKLKSVLEKKLTCDSTPRLRELYTILYGYVTRAIELNTGVEIEL